MPKSKKMILSAALMHGLGNQGSAWRVRGGPATDYISPGLYVELARQAEAAKLHALFLAEQMVPNPGSIADRPCGALDTVSVLSFMAALTKHIGLVGTGSTTYNYPYDLARRFATLDNLSNGRLGWNSVTTAHAATAQMFGSDQHLQAGDRYERADEFIDVVAALWESWEPDAIVDDKDRGIFADPSKIHEINHVGEHFSVLGPLPFPGSRQGRPVIFHAGSSPSGRDQAARVADVVFTAQHTTEGAIEFRTDIRKRAAGYGRDPDTVKVLPGINVVLGWTADEANRKKAVLEEALPIDQKLRSMSFRTGLSIEILRDHLDRPFPIDKLAPDDQLQGGTGWRKSTIDLATAENLTVRQLLARAPSGHHHIVGTAETVADAMIERMEAGAADGFTLMIDVLPEGMKDIATLLVPELQRRGIFHTDYEHSTLRDSLGIGAPRPLPARQAGKVPGVAKEHSESVAS